MSHNVFIKSLFIALMLVFINACVSSSGTREELTDKQQAVLYQKMGARYLEMGMLETAKENLEKAEVLDSNNTNTHNALGALYEQLKMLPEAKKQYQIAVALDKSNFSVRNNYGRFLCERGEYDAGIKILKEVLSMPLNNRKWFAFTNVARCELRKGSLKEAENNLRRALQVNKKYAPALFEMQKLSYHAEKYMSARAFLERYLEVARHNAETLWYAVQTERALGHNKIAEKYKQKLFNLFPLSKQAQQLKISN